MFEISVDSHFDAAHSLRNYQGDCARLHGHTWTVTVSLLSEGSGENGIVIDFREVEKILGKILSEFDHVNLNDLEYFRENNPTAENIARIIYGLFDLELPKKGVRLSAVTIGESPSCRVTYKEDS